MGNTCKMHTEYTKSGAIARLAFKHQQNMLIALFYGHAFTFCAILKEYFT